MNAPVPQAGPLADSRYRATEGLGIERRADRGGEHKVGRIRPTRAAVLFGILSRLVGPQEVDEGLGEMQVRRLPAVFRSARRTPCPLWRSSRHRIRTSGIGPSSFKSSEDIPSSSPLRSPTARATT